MQRTQGPNGHGSVSNKSFMNVKDRAASHDAMKVVGPGAELAGSSYVALGAPT